ncbi:MAG: tetratricopeptide repeat protein [Nitrospirota bacterium]|nr:tetratricopeptide repeat protein [Nitrospirota bacterium]
MRFYKYTPGLLSPEIIEQTLIGRDLELNNLERIIKNTATGQSCSHAILIGPKGIGKSHLLQIFYHSINGTIKRDGFSTYREKFVPVIFPEEEYPGNIAKFIKLILYYLSRKQDLTLPPMPTALTNAGVLGEKAKEEGIEYIKTFRMKTGKSLLLLVDNLNDIIERFTEEDQATLRELLTTCDSLLLVGAAPTLFDSIINHNKPLYNFFEVIWLKDLSFEDSIALLRRYADLEGKTDIALELREKEAKLRAIYELAGGNPRLLLSLYHIIAEKDLSSVEETFLKVLDELSPYFRERMKDLSEQQQEIIDAMAKADRLLTPTEIAAKCHMQVNIVNAQLKRLEKVGCVKISKKHAKKTLYDFSERLFSLWRQMRIEAGRKRLGFIVKLLEIWFTRDELFAYLDKTLGTIRERLTSDLSGVKPFIDRLWYIKEAIKEFKGHSEAHTAFQRKEHDVALSLLKEEIHRAPNNPVLWHNLGVVFFNLRKFKDAFTSFQKVTQLKPNDSEGWANLGSAAYELGDANTAIDVLKKAVEARPDDADTWNNVGTVYLNLKEYTNALQAFKEVIRIRPADVPAWTNLGNTYNSMGKYDEALDAYNNVLKYKPDDSDAWNNIGVTLDNLKQFPRAIDAYKKAIEINTDKQRTWYNLGITYANTSKYEEAANAFEHAVKLRPDSPESWNNLGSSYAALQRFEDALVAYQKSISLRAEGSAAIYNLAVTYDQLHRYDEALDNYEKALKINSNEAGAWNNLGVIYGRRKNLEKAIDCFRRSLFIDVNDEDSIANLLFAFKQAIEQGNITVVSDALLSMKQSGQIELLAQLSPLSAFVNYVNTGDVSVLDRLRVEERSVVEEMITMFNKHNKIRNK